jgi:sporulation protein YlmC with PRC-barrel domain
MKKREEDVMLIATNMLRPLSDTDLKIAEGNEDVRGRHVIDSNGEDIGTVDDLLIDNAERKVRFLRVGSGGFLGLGKTTSLIPVDAITRIDAKHVHVDTTRERVAESPPYNPQCMEESYWDHVYQHYGCAPYWASGHTPR